MSKLKSAVLKTISSNQSLNNKSRNAKLEVLSESSNSDKPKKLTYTPSVDQSMTMLLIPQNFNFELKKSNSELIKETNAT